MGRRGGGANPNPKLFLLETGVGGSMARHHSAFDELNHFALRHSQHGAHTSHTLSHMNLTSPSTVFLLDTEMKPVPDPECTLLGNFLVFITQERWTIFLTRIEGTLCLKKQNSISSTSDDALMIVFESKSNQNKFELQTVNMSNSERKFALGSLILQERKMVEDITRNIFIVQIMVDLNK